MANVIAPDIAAALLVEELRQFGVEIEDSARRRSEYSYDASDYRVQPAAVAFPRNVADIREVLRISAAHGLVVTMRGGGTSMVAGGLWNPHPAAVWPATSDSKQNTSTCR